MPFTVASWNVLADAYIRADLYKDCHPDAIDPALRFGRLVDGIEALNADVVCLQEVQEDFSSRLAVAIPWKRCFAKKGGGRKDGCEIRMRPPAAPGPWDSFRYSDGSGHVAIVAIVPLPEGPVAVATTHLKWDPPGTPAEKRFGFRQADELIAGLRERASGLPWIACGDFNVTADDPVLARFAEAGLRDAYASMPRANTCVANGRARRIDFLLYTADLMSNPRPLPLLADDAILPSIRVPSDHLPIAATFERLR
ncbi:MAG: endonuclease/exonuclease/phosphatase family protein [Planctomycetota bacterium]